MATRYFDPFKPPRRNILEALLDGRRSLGELAGRLKISRPAASKHLKEMVVQGLLGEQMEKTDRGRTVYYELKRWTLLVSFDPELGRYLEFQTYEPFDEGRILIEQLSAGEFKEDLRELVGALDGLDKDVRPECVILFGSVARGQGTWKSDIDIALVREEWSNDIKDLLEALISKVMVNTTHGFQPQFITSLKLEMGETTLLNEIRDTGLIISGGLFERRSIWKVMKRYKNIST